MPFGFHLSNCRICGKPFITDDCIDFICPYCNYEEYMKTTYQGKEQDKEKINDKIDDT